MPDRLQRWVLSFFLPILTVVLATFFFLGGSKYLAGISLLCVTFVVLPIYFINAEIFILFLLFINGEYFYLLPRTIIQVDYQSVLYFALLLLLAVGYLFKKINVKKIMDFQFFVISLLCLIFIGIFVSSANGQPFTLGFRAAKYYFFILFYFIFLFRKINVEKLAKLVIITGILLAIFNNLQYLHWGKINIFYYHRELMRAGVLRFLVGGFFTIFAPLLAFGEYLRTNKKTYLLAFLYMAGTIILQGQTRMIIAGLLVSLSLMLYFSKKLNFIKAMFLGGIMIIIFTWIVPIIVEKTFFGKLLPLTRQEIIKKEGSYGVRLKGYEYYMSKINESPFLGSGIWYDSYRGANPENVTHKGIYLSDLGITGFLFHFGFLGLIWMLLLFRKIYIALFKNITTVNRAIPYGILGYFIFGVSVMSTIDCFFSQGTILYFSLALAILSQAKNKA